MVKESFRIDLNGVFTSEFPLSTAKWSRVLSSESTLQSIFLMSFFLALAVSEKNSVIRCNQVDINYSYEVYWCCILYTWQLKDRPIPSSLVPLSQSESKCKTILMKMTLICMKMRRHAELIFIWKVSHLDSCCNRGTRELRNGVLNTYQPCQWMFTRSSV